MNLSSKIKITAYPISPIAIGNTFLSLDAILYGILHDKFHEIANTNEILDRIPLKSQDGVFFSSKAYFENQTPYSYVKIGGMRPPKDQYYFDSTDQINFKSKIDAQRGRFKSNISRYKCISSERVFWLAQGNAELIKTILDSSKSIGALRKEGYGVIRKFEIEEISNVDILVDEFGDVRRPIPVRLGQLFAAPPASPTAMETWRPPYWDRSGLEECYV